MKRAAIVLTLLSAGTLIVACGEDATTGDDGNGDASPIPSGDDTTTGGDDDVSPTSDGGSVTPVTDSGKTPDAAGPSDAAAPSDAGDGGGKLDASDGAAPTYAVGGMVAGLPGGGSVSLKNNGGDEITRSANGAYAFPTKLKSGDGYEVTVSASAPAGYECTVANGKANVAGADVTNANVTCAPIPASCLAIKTANAAAADGVYAIYAGGAKFNVYCDMTTDGGGWTKILQYKDAAYTPTIAAAGNIAVAGTPAFAKLSDAQINAIGGATAKTYRYQGAQTTKKLFVQTAAAFNDTARAMGLGGAVDACEADSFAACSPTPENAATTDTVGMGISANDKDRYFTDYSGVAECYPTTGANARCFNAGVSTGHVRIDDFSLWMREPTPLPAAKANWKLDENAGAAFADSSGNGFNATTSSGAWAAGHAGSGYNGIGVMTGDLPALTTFTISLWATRVGVGSGGVPRILSFPGDALEIADNGGSFAIFAPSIGWATTVAFGVAFAHYTVSAGGGTVRVYQNGALVQTYSGTPTISGKMSFGVRSNGGGESFNGVYDEVRIYDRALWPTEVDALSKL